MTIPAVPPRNHVSRSRRTSRPSGDDREVAILATAEQLLCERPLHEISVDDLARGAGISRPTFYFYFPSKDAVWLTLLERVIEEVNSAIDTLNGKLPSDPADFWRTVIAAFFDAFGSHRWVVPASAAALATKPEFREVWRPLMQKWIDQTAALITTERARGAAPDTIPPEDLAISLNLMNERAMMATFSGEQPHVDNEKVVDTLTHVWLTSIYGTAR